VLLAAKLRVPRLRPGFAPRPRLLERLAEGMGRDLVLLCTAPGFGKTSLMSDWARRDQRLVGWLALAAERVKDMTARADDQRRAREVRRARRARASGPMRRPGLPCTQAEPERPPATTAVAVARRL
jgi:hypothetical protein